MTKPVIPLLLAAALLGGGASAQVLPKQLPTVAELANDNALFLKVARKALHWEEAEDPVHIAGPIYFVGTKGLGAFLFVTG